MLNTLKKVTPNPITLNDQDWLNSWLSDSTNLSQFGTLLGKNLQHRDYEGADLKQGNLIGLLDITNNEPVFVYSGMSQLHEQHIGALLTLMGKADYTTLIWITNEIQNNLIATLKWLNTVTEDRFSFFGIQTEFWCIADSLPAPVFRVKAAPHNWQNNETPPRVTPPTDSSKINLNTEPSTQKSQPVINNKISNNPNEETSTTSTVNHTTETSAQELQAELENTLQTAVTVRLDKFKDIFQENNNNNDDDDDYDDDDDDDDATSRTANISLSSHDIYEEIELNIPPDHHNQQPMDMLSNFWEGVNTIIESRDSALQATLAFPQTSISFQTEHPEHSLVAQLDPEKQQATVKLILIGSQGNTDFLTLEHMKRIIERELSTPLYWTSGHNDADCEIMVVNNRIDLSTEKTQLEVQYWIVERLEKFHEMLTRYFVFD